MSDWQSPGCPGGPDPRPTTTPSRAGLAGVGVAHRAVALCRLHYTPLDALLVGGRHPLPPPKPVEAAPVPAWTQP